MSTFPNFDIKPIGQISNEFIQRNILTFKEATKFVQHLPYKRNTNTEHLISVFSDNCGTCSSKHALLKQLADENNFKGLQLMIGLFKMSATTTPHVADTLKKFKLKYIPEAHNYLKFEGSIFDFTKPSMQPSDYVDYLIEEIEILPNQISTYKVAYHKNYIKNWLEQHPKIRYSEADIWAIREWCIRDLSK